MWKFIVFVRPFVCVCVSVVIYLPSLRIVDVEILDIILTDYATFSLCTILHAQSFLICNANFPG